MDNASSTEILDLIQFMRVATLDNLEHLWKQVLGNDEHRYVHPCLNTIQSYIQEDPFPLLTFLIRRWFLDLVVEVTDERILKFLEARYKARDITANEAGQALVVAFNHLSAEPVSVALAQVRR